jgi:two-component system response regulator CpxR
MRLLLIEDDRELCALLQKFLKSEALSLEFLHTGDDALGRIRKGGIDLVVLDVMLPGIDGFEVLRRIRRENSVPVIMLTARGEDIDRIVGLELGADDYLPKPFNPRELAARIRSIFRRIQTSPDRPAERIEANGVKLDTGSREVCCEGRRIELTTLEFDILEVLIRSAGRVLTRDSLIKGLYGREPGPYDRSIDMHISNLRRKLRAGRTLIRTVRGTGYQFARSAEVRT